VKPNEFVTGGKWGGRGGGEGRGGRSLNGNKKRGKRKDDGGQNTIPRDGKKKWGKSAVAASTTSP